MKQCKKFFKTQLIFAQALLLIFSFSEKIFPFDNTGTYSFELSSIFPTGGRISGSGIEASQGGFLIFSEDRYIYRFNDNGIFLERKKSFAGRPTPFHAVGIDGIIYKFFDTNVLKAINQRGNILRIFNTASFFEKINSNPLVTSTGNIVAEGEGKIISFSYSGRKRWELAISDISAPLCAGINGTLYVGRASGVIEVISDSGEQGKAITIGSEVTALTFNPYTELLFAADKRGRLSLFDNTGKLMKTTFLKSPAIFLSVDNGITAAVLEDGTAAVFNKNLEITVARKGDRDFTGKPIITNDSVFFTRKNGFITKLLYNKKPGWKTIEQMPISQEALSVVKQGKKEERYPLLYQYKNGIAAGGLDWNIYFFQGKELLKTTENKKKSKEKKDTASVTTPDKQYLFYIRSLSISPEIDNKKKSVTLLEEIIEEGFTGNDEKFILQLLEKLVFENKSFSGSTRISIAEILGILGTHEAINLLRIMLSMEKDEYTAAALIKKLGNAGSDPRGDTVRLFYIAERQFTNSVIVKENIIFSLEKIHQYHGYFTAEEGDTILREIFEKTNNSELKLKILDIFLGL